MIWGLTIEKNTVKYGRTAYMPYQERWRERPDETRQPVKELLGNSSDKVPNPAATRDEDSIDTHIGSAPCVLFYCFL